MDELNHKGTQVIETKRLILRPFCALDAQAVYNNWASDPQVTRYLSWPYHAELAITQQVLDMWLEAYNERTYHWAIVLKELGEPIGSITFHNMNQRDLRTEVGYCIGRPWWSAGLVTEALTAVLDFAFKEVGFNRIEAIHSKNNPASGAVMRKVGMSYEGHSRQVYRDSCGELQDCDLYAVLRQDWKV